MSLEKLQLFASHLSVEKVSRMGFDSLTQNKTPEIIWCFILVPRAGIGHKSLIHSRLRPRLAPCVAPAFDYLSKRSHANKN